MLQRMGRAGCFLVPETHLLVEGTARREEGCLQPRETQELRGLAVRGLVVRELVNPKQVTLEQGALEQVALQLVDWRAMDPGVAALVLAALGQGAQEQEQEDLTVAGLKQEELGQEAQDPAYLQTVHPRDLAERGRAPE